MSNEPIIGKNTNPERAIKQAGLKLSDGGNVSRETFHHEEIMDQMIKAIEYSKLDKKTRSVLLLRLIHGFTIERMQVHLFLTGNIFGNSRDELLAIEAEGKRQVLETLKKHSMSDIIGSINATPGIITGLRNELTHPGNGLS